MSTFLEMQTNIIADMQLDPGLISVDERKRFINKAIDDLSLINLWIKDASLEVDAGDSEVTLPTDFLLPLNVFWGDSELVPVKRTSTPGGTSGTPTGYIMKPGIIELVPATNADGNLFVTYTYKGIHLTTDASVPNFHLDACSAIENYATAMCHRKNGNIFMYNQYYGMYIQQKGVFIDVLTRESNSRVNVIKFSDTYMNMSNPSELLGL
jgi:hypothetical protein